MSYRTGAPANRKVCHKCGGCNHFSRKCYPKKRLGKIDVKTLWMNSKKSKVVDKVDNSS